MSYKIFYLTLVLFTVQDTSIHYLPDRACTQSFFICPKDNSWSSPGENTHLCAVPCVLLIICYSASL